MIHFVLTMMHTMSHTRYMSDIDQWIRAVTNGDSDRKIAEKVGMPTATMNRHLRGNMPPETMVKIARAYGASAVRALVTYGLLESSDVEAAAVLDALEDATDEQIADQALRRMKAGSAAYDRPLSDYGKPLALTAVDQPGRPDAEVYAELTQDDFEKAAGFRCSEHDDDEDDFEVEFP